MKTTLERVYEALNKVELKSEKIELGLWQDTKTHYNLIMKFKETAESQLAKAKYTAAAIETEIKEFNKDANKAEQIAKELGVSPKDMNLQKLFQDIKQAEKLAKDISNA
tara:strand:+ start:289 stop:615 length:327 start_codon:yes stop_codon:yes gene_type:complete